MIEINLLPEELRKKEGLRLPKEFYIIGVGVLSFLIVLHATTGMIIKWKRYRVVKLTQRWAELAPLRKSVDVIRQETADLDKRAGGIDRLMVRRFLWSEKLNQLSNLVIPGIWIRTLSLNPSPPSKNLPLTLNLKGSVVSRQGEEMAIVGKFITNLKNDRDFSEDFNNIELKSIQRRGIRGTEVMDFVLVCHFKEIAP